MNEDLLFSASTTSKARTSIYLLTYMVIDGPSLEGRVLIIKFSCVARTMLLGLSAIVFQAGTERAGRVPVYRGLLLASALNASGVNCGQCEAEVLEKEIKTKASL